MARVFGPYHARVVDVRDGDTVLLDLDLGFGFTLNARDWDGHPQLSCRVYGINSPELSTEAGKVALAFAKTLLAPGNRCLVLSHGWDKYGGRFNGTITLADGRDFAATMVENGQAIVANY
jgi:endonuclease YncB( thermonuclease family)